MFEDVAPAVSDDGVVTHIHTVAELQSATAAAAAAAGSSSALEYFQKHGVTVCEALGRGDGAVLTTKQFDAQLARMAFAASVSTKGVVPRTPKRARDM